MILVIGGAVAFKSSPTAPTKQGIVAPSATIQAVQPVLTATAIKPVATETVAVAQTSAPLVKPREKFPREAQAWIAWHLSRVCVAADNPPCTVRLYGRENAARFRDSWDAPGGPPPDPDFLIELKTIWQARVVRTLSTHSEILAGKLNHLREQVIQSLPDSAREEYLQQLARQEDEWAARWQECLESGSVKAEYRSTVPALNPGRILEKINLRKWAAEEQGLWREQFTRAILDLKNLAVEIENKPANQLGPEQRVLLKKAFVARAELDQRISEARCASFIQSRLAGDDPEKTQREYESRFNDLIHESSLKTLDQELRVKGVLRSTMDSGAGLQRLSEQKNFLKSLWAQIAGSAPATPMQEKF